MLTHSDEYFNQFEFADVLADHEFDAESEENLFLHVVFHAVEEPEKLSSHLDHFAKTTPFFEEIFQWKLGNVG